MCWNIQQLTYKIFTSVNCGPVARLELFTRPDGQRSGWGQRHIQLYSPWLPANDKSNPGSAPHSLNLGCTCHTCITSHASRHASESLTTQSIQNILCAVNVPFHQVKVHSLRRASLYQVRLLQPGFLGCAKLKQAERGYTTRHDTTYPSGRGRPLLCMHAEAHCKILH